MLFAGAPWGRSNQLWAGAPAAAQGAPAETAGALAAAKRAPATAATGAHTTTAAPAGDIDCPFGLCCKPAAGRRLLLLRRTCCCSSTAAAAAAAAAAGLACDSVCAEASNPVSECLLRHGVYIHPTGNACPLLLLLLQLCMPQ